TAAVLGSGALLRRGASARGRARRRRDRRRAAEAVRRDAMPLQTLVVFLLGAAGAGGLLWVFLYPLLSGERKAEQRKASVARPERASRAAPARGAGRSRREQIEETLKELELRQKQARAPALPLRIAQAGLS